MLIAWFAIPPCKYYDWKKRYGCRNCHNGWIPRDWWILDSEKESIIDYYQKHPFDGYRRLTYMMLDEDIVAVSPATVYRVLSNAKLLGRNKVRLSKKGTGFKQPGAPHKHWHIDICYINIDGTFYYMCTIIDGYSRYIVHWEIREAMKEVDVEIILQRAKEKFPGVSPRIISDNGPQFISKDFKEYIRFSGMTHVRTSPYYPQSNGKVEQVQKTLKNETIRKHAPETLDEAISIMGKYIEHYNNERLHSSIDYITPVDKLYGKAPFILNERDRKLSDARDQRKQAHTLMNVA